MTDWSSRWMGVRRESAVARLHARLQARTLALAGLLTSLALLGGVLAYLPRLHYPHPLHADEWTHIAEARQFLETGGPSRRDAVTGEDRGALHPEFGFHALLAGLSLLTGRDPIDVTRVFPLVAGAALALGGFAFARRQGFGMEAALFAGFLPTTDRLLGPGFALPAAVGLILTAPMLMLLESAAHRRSATVAFGIVLAALFVIHPPTAILLLGATLLQTGALIASPGEIGRPVTLRRTILLFAVCAVAAAPFGLMQSSIVGRVSDTQAPLGLIDTWRMLVQRLGAPIFAFAVIGAFGLARSRDGGAQRRLWLTCTLTVFVVAMAWWPRIPETLWSRGAMVDALLILLTAAGGFAICWRALARIIANRTGLRTAKASVLAVAVLALPLTALQLHSHMDERFYHLVSREQAQTFRWIGRTLCTGYDLALVDDSLSRPFAALSGRHVYNPVPLTVAPGYSSDRAAAQAELAAGVPDSAWLRERGITMVYSERPVLAADLIPARPHLYLISPSEVCADSRSRPRSE